ncbi:MAG: hypothetical protein LBD05_02380, partial [Mycoplasmataceae bacterium]|nr:hypothetical protein [Mycoplasmataceae bacterium]
MRCDNSKKAILLIKKILALFVVFFSIFIFLFSTYWFNSKKASIVNENNAHFNTTNIKSETLSENKSNMFHFVGEYYFNTEDTPLIISGTSSDTDTTVTSSEIKFWYY